MKKRFRKPIRRAELKTNNLKPLGTSPRHVLLGTQGGKLLTLFSKNWIFAKLLCLLFASFVSQNPLNAEGGHRAAHVSESSESLAPAKGLKLQKRIIRPAAKKQSAPAPSPGFRRVKKIESATGTPPFKNHSE